MLGPERLEFRANDDGEPSSTAGKPILGQINSNELTDILIVVVRYYGGVNLGTSGLIVAYREAARDALEKAEIVKRDVMCRARVSFPIEKTNEVMRLIRATQSVVVAQDYTDRYIYTLDVKNACKSQWSDTDYTINVEFF